MQRLRIPRRDRYYQSRQASIPPLSHIRKFTMHDERVVFSHGNKRQGNSPPSPNLEDKSAERYHADPSDRPEESSAGYRFKGIGWMRIVLFI
jgi:hypothetical protein